jgi:hypothetical protein
MGQGLIFWLVEEWRRWRVKKRGVYFIACLGEVLGDVFVDFVDVLIFILFLIVQR